MHKIKAEYSLKSIKQYDEKVLNFISFLFKDITKKQWEWEYLHSPNKSIVKVCVFDNTIIGHYALIMFPMLLSGAVISGAKAEGSLVDINVIRRLQKSNRDVFGRLVESCLVEFSTFDRFAIFGFPNSNALPSQLKHGYDHIKIKGYEKIYVRNPLYLAKNIHVLIKPFFIILSALYKKIVDFIVFYFFNRTGKISKMKKQDEDDLNTFSFKLSAKYHNVLMIHRTYQYYEWRIIDNPYVTGDVLLSRGVDGEIDALIAYSIENNMHSKYMKIQDIAILDYKAGSLLFNKILHIMIDYEIDALALWELENNSIAEMKFHKFIPFFSRKNILNKSMIFYSNLFKSLSLSQDNIDISLIYKRF